MTILYERILTFVTSKVSESSRHSQRFTTYKPCSTVTEMVTRLACFNWPKDLRIVILIDEADRLFQLDSNSFSVLLRLPEMVNPLIINLIRF